MMISFPFLKFTILIFEFYFFVRAFVQFHKIDLENHQYMTKIGTFLFLLLFALIKALLLKQTLLFFGEIILFFAIEFMQSFVREHRENEFHKETVYFLTKTILKMRTGESLRESLATSLHSERDIFRKRFRKISDFVSFSQQTSENWRFRFDKKIAEALRRASESQQDVIYQVEILRSHLKLEVEFRRKSGQALHQVYLQMAIMAVIYIAAFIFTSMSYSLYQFKELYFVSACLFVTGNFIIFRLGKRIRWNI